MESIIENKVATSGLISLDIESHLPIDEIANVDMKDFLFQELILKEQDFRNHLKDLNLTPFNNKLVYVTCSADAIVPTWAFMLLSITLQSSAKKVFMVKDKNEMYTTLAMEFINELPVSEYENQRVIIKGCSKIKLEEKVFVSLALKLKPVVKSLMFGEPCSTVPLYKKK